LFTYYLSPGLLSYLLTYLIGWLAGLFLRSFVRLFVFCLSDSVYNMFITMSSLI